MPSQMRIGKTMSPPRRSSQGPTRRRAKPEDRFAGDVLLPHLHGSKMGLIRAYSVWLFLVDALA